MHYVQVLLLDGNELRSLQGLGGLAGLQRLSVRSNQLTSLQVRAACLARL